MFTVHTVSVNEYKDTVTLTSTDNREIHIELGANCCSSSYFEDNSLEDMKSLVGEIWVKFQAVEAYVTNTDVGYDKYASYHALKITTNKQNLVIGWRNELNGYGKCYITGDAEVMVRCDNE